MPLNVSGLKQGVQYKVRKPFSDFYNNRFNEGEVLTFLESNFLPYHGGYTIIFKEKRLYLQEEKNADILDSLGDYFSMAITNPDVP